MAKGFVRIFTLEIVYIRLSCNKLGNMRSMSAVLAGMLLNKQKDHYALPTERITQALNRLKDIIVQGNYRVRSVTKAIAYPIHGSLF